MASGKLIMAIRAVQMGLGTLAKMLWGMGLSGLQEDDAYGVGGMCVGGRKP